MKNIKIILITTVIILAATFGIYKLFIEHKADTNISAKNAVYTCPMHPQIISDHPGTCPICGMDLVLKDMSHSDTTKTSANINDVVLSPSQQVLANLQTQIVEEKTISTDLEFNGYIKYNESAMRHISTPVSGNILKQYITFEGQYVRAGERAFDIYSPEMLSTQKEYLLALSNYQKSLSTNNSIVIEQAQNLLNSTMTRLKLLQLSPNQIKSLEETGEVKNYITIYTKYSGIITKKYAHEGHWAVAGEDIYDVTDVSSLWAIANINESDIRFIKKGQKVEIKSVAYPDEEFYGRVDFINPSLKMDTRTLEVRIDVPNKNNKLLPDMYVKVIINSDAETNQVAVPVTAVVRTGKMDMVYIKTSDNTFTPKKVTISGERQGYYLISSGISIGEEIVTSAGFLLDSESQIRMGSSTHNHGDKSDNNSKKKDDTEIHENQDAMKDMKK
ncbi:MAG: efflux RND transporter periplasmic adaptor subunit [Ignavibacteria bacterium]|jgi:RND family efflux transporter MFP subunit|nr:efflux RND transporter periplasmic adaptor subunit [Ignavibacteria bacterium]